MTNKLYLSRDLSPTPKKFQMCQTWTGILTHTQFREPQAQLIHRQFQITSTSPSRDAVASGRLQVWLCLAWPSKWANLRSQLCCQHSSHSFVPHSPVLLSAICFLCFCLLPHTVVGWDPWLFLYSQFPGLWEPSWMAWNLILSSCFLSFASCHSLFVLWAYVAFSGMSWVNAWSMDNTDLQSLWTDIMLSMYIQFNLKLVRYIVLRSQCELWFRLWMGIRSVSSAFWH